MTLSSNFENYEYDSILGTPTSQQILLLLSVWNELSIRDFKEKTGLSKSQIHNTIKNLSKINVIIKIKRGSYTLSEAVFVRYLKQSFLSNSINVVNKKIYLIKQLLKEKDIESAHQEFKQMIELYDPLLKNQFSRTMHSVSHHFLDYYGVL